MYIADAATQALFKNNHYHAIRITVTKTGQATFTITGADIVEGGLTIDRYSTTLKRIELATCCAAELSLTLSNYNGQFTGKTFAGAELFVEIGAGDPVTYVPMGYFIVDGIPKTEKRLKISALDRMLLFERTLPSAFINTYTTPKDIVEAACTACGITLATDLTTLPNYSIAVDTDIDTSEMTYRDILQYASLMMGVSAFIDHAGELELQWYTATGYTLDVADRFKSEIDETIITLTGLSYTDNNGTYTAGTDTYQIAYKNVPLIPSSTAQTIVTAIYNTIGGLSYQPFEAVTMAMPYVWPLSTMTYVDEGGASHDIIVTHTTFTANNSTTIKGVGDTDSVVYNVGKTITANDLTSTIINMSSKFLVPSLTDTSAISDGTNLDMITWTFDAEGGIVIANVMMNYTVAVTTPGTDCTVTYTWELDGTTVDTQTATYGDGDVIENLTYLLSGMTKGVHILVLNVGASGGGLS